MSASLFRGIPRQTLVDLYIGACERIVELENDLEGRITNEPGTSWGWLEDGTLHVALSNRKNPDERSSMTLIPRGDRITASPIAADEKVGSVFLPDDAREKTQRATILAVGTAPEVADLAAGDVIVYAKYGGTVIDHEGSDVLILRDSDVIAKVS